MAHDDAPAPRTPEGREVLRLADLYARAVIDYGHAAARHERGEMATRDLARAQRAPDEARAELARAVRAWEDRDGA